ncbi:MAG: lipopolysaccharide assembly protein LapB [Gammaproteobacteria bacterium]|nr:lipopolysaccharide assembly protein LapB [Gammaproteobacteria bacterium]
MSLLFWLLLPVAAASGWLAARRSFSSEAKPHKLSSDYLKGLNYLLNEQPDKAIDVFIKLIDVNSETIETHLALGVLFRRRGEMNRAIRIHQNLVSRPALTLQQRSLAILELGQDYQRAGLLDRAEELFKQLINEEQYRNFAYRQLLDIYQQEHDWEKAINTAEKLGENAGEDYNPIIAQYLCEQAERYRDGNQFERTLHTIRRALRADFLCVRASLAEGHLALHQGNINAAINAFKRVEQQDSRFLPEVIDPLQICYRSCKRLDEFAAYLHHVVQVYGGITPLLMLAKIIKEQEGEQKATDFVVHQLRERPSIRGLAHFLDIALPGTKGIARENLLLLKEITTQLLKNKPVYKCDQCGFTGKSLHWQCPSCKQWNTLEPIQGIDGE